MDAAQLVVVVASLREGKEGNEVGLIGVILEYPSCHLDDEKWHILKLSCHSPTKHESKLHVSNDIVSFRPVRRGRICVQTAKNCLETETIVILILHSHNLFLILW